jgi:methionyl-tRNA formyltransferase
VNLYLSGSKAFGAAVYRMLRDEGHNIVGGCTPPWASDGERRDQLRHLIEDDARAPWLPAGELNQHTLPDDVDLLVAAHSYDWIGKATRHRCRIGAIGYHPSLLPRHRGRSSVEWTIRMGDPVAGGSVYWLDDRVDAGNVLCQDWCWVRPGDTPGELWRRDLFPMGVRLLDQAVTSLNVVGWYPAKPQLEECATWEPAIDPPRIRRPDLPELNPAR